MDAKKIEYQMIGISKQAETYNKKNWGITQV